MKCVSAHILKLPERENALGSWSAGHYELFVFLTSHFCNHVRPDFTRGQIFLHCFITGGGERMMWAQKMMCNQRDKNKVSCHTDSFNETKSCFAALLIYSFINEDSGRENTAIHTDIDVNKFYLPTFSNTSNCQTQGGSLSQERSTLWISLSHVPLEDSPLVPIANIKVKYSWKQGVQVLVTYLKICLHWHQNWSRPVRGA